MTRAEESALIFKILNGDKDLFRQIVDAHGGMILAVLYRMTGNREDAEDMAQETFVNRFLITAFYEQGRSLAELTEITGMSLSNVKVRLFRCRNRLAKILKDNKDLEQ